MRFLRKIHAHYTHTHKSDLKRNVVGWLVLVFVMMNLIEIKCGFWIGDLAMVGELGGWGDWIELK